MKLSKLLCVCATSVVVFGLCFAGEPHATKQLVRSWIPGYDTTGISWYHCDLRLMQTNHANYLTKYSIGCYVQYNAGTNSAAWTAEEGNMPDDWLSGDTCVTIGSMDTAYVHDAAGYNENATHTGFYFLFSDTLVGTTATQTWKPDDTLRVMPMPVVSQTASYETVYVEIENPVETDHAPWGAFPYDVIGYWLLVAKKAYPIHPEGKPDEFTDTLGFFPVQGGPGGSTIIGYDPRDFFWPDTYYTYHAYQIVARPDTTDGKGARQVCPGFKTDYMSQNSNEIVVIGIAEQNNGNVNRYSLCAMPSVFSRTSDIAFSVPVRTRVLVAIYDLVGNRVKTLVNEVKAAGRYNVVFDGTTLPNGVYFCRLETPEKALTSELVKLR